MAVAINEREATETQKGKVYGKQRESLGVIGVHGSPPAVIDAHEVFSLFFLYKYF